MVVVKKPDAQVSRDVLLKVYEGKTAKWKIPDDVVVVEAIPIGASGTASTATVRAQWAASVLPTA